ncbi:hypothetical protein L596_030173 [Steinernema carpocapsae]|uniref:Uncharacterized protein n=1 Tax=Steinernema carpocapsae TaxID=34508 RepID=A0A4U5LRX9_STECR|nr:hypothetical protein L596_030173 [Steinernema carpocapsae]
MQRLPEIRTLRGPTAFSLRTAPLQLARWVSSTQSSCFPRTRSRDPIFRQPHCGPRRPRLPPQRSAQRPSAPRPKKQDSTTKQRIENSGRCTLQS